MLYKGGQGTGQGTTYQIIQRRDALNLEMESGVFTVDSRFIQLVVPLVGTTSIAVRWLCPVLCRAGGRGGDKRGLAWHMRGRVIIAWMVKVVRRGLVCATRLRLRGHGPGVHVLLCLAGRATLKGAKGSVLVSETVLLLGVQLLLLLLLLLLEMRVRVVLLLLRLRRMLSLLLLLWMWLLWWWLGRRWWRRGRRRRRRW